MRPDPLDNAPLALDEWSTPFHITVEYEVQITGQMRVWLNEMRADGARPTDIADEIVSRLHGDHNVNVVGAASEIDEPMEEVLGGS